MSLSSCEDFSSVWSDLLVNSVKIEDDGDATDIMSLLQSLCPVLDLKIDLSLLKIVLNDSPYSKPWGFTPKSSLLHFQNQCYNLTPRSCPWPPTAPSPVLDLQIDLMFLKMITNDCPYQKSLG